MQKGKVDGPIKADTYVFISPEDLRTVADQMSRLAVETSKTGQSSITFRLTDNIVLYYEPKAILPPNLEKPTSNG